MAKCIDTDNIGIWMISAETEPPTVGYPCLDNYYSSERFLSKSTKSSLRHRIDAPGYDYELMMTNCQTSRISQIIPIINKYAELTPQENSQGNESSFSIWNFNEEEVKDCTNVEPYPGAGCGVQCSCCGCCGEGGIMRVQKTTGGNNGCIALIEDLEGTPAGCSNSRNRKENSCPSEACYNPADGDLYSESCQQINSFKNSTNNDVIGITETSFGFVEILLQEQVPDSYRMSLANSMSRKKVEIYNYNQDQNSEGLRCEGGNDGCWGDFGGSIKNMSTIGQAFGIALSTNIDDDPEKIMNGVGGKIIIYVGGGDTSPCCDPENFYGEIISEQVFGITKDSESFKGERATKIFFNNSSYDGSEESLKYCITNADTPTNN